MMDQIFQTEQTFDSLGLREDLLRGLRERGFVHPTPIQAQIIPIALSGRDVLGQARTGTGKTAAFGLPVITMIDIDRGVQAVILVPTRELAVQVARELRELAKYTHVNITPIYGGERRKTQIARLRKHPHIVVGTPGRVMDLLDARELSFEDVRFAVLDEVDRMLDIGFRDDIRQILSRIPGPHQTIFVSATIAGEIEQLARKYMRDPEKIVSSAGSLTVAAVDQSHLLVQRWDKKRLLHHLLTHEEPALTLVFCNTKREVDRVAEYLAQKNVEVHAIHGDLYQKKRDRVMQKFRDGALSVLIASDVASRGLDVENISHVINYDVPLDPELYVHRIGRTARIGRGGIAWMFVTPDEGALLSNIENFINKEVPRKMYEDFEPGPIPATVLADRERARELSEKLAVQASRSTPSTIDEKAARDATKFPGGVVPVAAPERRMHGRLRGRRR
jgi:ATP-dependent RNA helicase DeaD